MPPKKRKSDTSENKSLEDYFGQSSKRIRKVEEMSQLKFDLEWVEYGEPTSKNVKPLYYLWSKSQPSCSKVAAFDIDHTIITTKSGRSFPTNAQDWKWFDKCVPEKLKELNDKGFRILFITNQAGIEKQKVKFAELKTKFEAMIAELDIPVFVFVATGENHFRKPSTEIWQFFLKNCNKSSEIDYNESFYVGDAAGRPKNWAPGKGKDFSCADRMFAHNLNLKFHTPEEFFLNHKQAAFEWGSIDPNEILKKKEKQNAKNLSYHLNEQEMILFVGPPASGKSTIVKRFFLPHGYVHVNRDTLQTQEKCLKAVENALKEGKSVCVDNTNPAKKTRAEYINLAKKYNLKHIRCFKMATELDLCHHLNYVRQNYTKGKVRRVPDVGYNTFKSQYEEPTSNEGFSEILKIDFIPIFDDNEHEATFKQWTT